jgi:hypothetical protein
LIGATTRLGSLSNPLRNRFGSTHRLEFYTPQEIEKIVKRSSSILNIGLDEEGAKEIASSSRQTPRVANRILKRVRDYAETKNFPTITGDIARDALRLYEIDPLSKDSRADRQDCKPSPPSPVKKCRPSRTSSNPIFSSWDFWRVPRAAGSSPPKATSISISTCPPVSKTNYSNVLSKTLWACLVLVVK